MTSTRSERHVCPKCGREFGQPTWCAGNISDPANPHRRQGTGTRVWAVTEQTIRKAASS